MKANKSRCAREAPRTVLPIVLTQPSMIRSQNPDGIAGPTEDPARSELAVGLLLAWNSCEAGWDAPIAGHHLQRRAGFRSMAGEQQHHQMK